MMLYLNTDTCYKTGWEGYDFMVSPANNTHKYSLFRHAGNAYTWENIGEIIPFVSGNKMYFAISRSLLDMENGKDCDIDFKWADNTPYAPDVLDFYTDGDVAPNGRFNYRYKGSLVHTEPTAIKAARAGDASVMVCQNHGGKLQLSIQSAAAGAASVDVFSHSGELISRKSVHLHVGGNTVFLGCTHAPAIVRVTQNGKSRTCKVL